jgi:apolipoprotein N-acyltransferase
MSIRKNIFLALTSGLLLGLPWSAPSLFFVVFIAWGPLLLVEAEVRNNHPANSYAIFNYAFVSFMLWNIIGTWWVMQAQLVGAILIIIANWPWLNLGNALATTPKLIQWYEFTGVRGGTLWIILTNFAALKVYHTYRQKGPGSIVAPGAITLMLFLIPIVVSYLIFQSFEEEGEPVNIALIQPNLDPYTEKFDPANYARHVESFFKTADAIVDDETQYLIGPETLIVEQIDEKNPAASTYYRDLLEFSKKYPNLNILLGVHSYQKLGDANIPPGSRFNREENFYYEAFNTALFLPAGPAPVPQFYHKTKLVPLFERMPFVQYLGFLGKYSLELGGYTGTYSLRQENTTFVLPDGSVTILPIVCFESIFGPYCSRNLPKEAGFICMITNDGWWKNTPGYRHHFNFSRLSTPLQFQPGTCHRKPAGFCSGCQHRNFCAD